jgi:vancomycin resistance protein VanJ
MKNGFADRLRRLGAGFTWVASWTILVLTGAAAIALSWAGDSSWQMTLLTFGPRWVALLPLAPLVAGALLFRRRALLPLALAGSLAAGPVMGFCIPWRALVSREPPARSVVRVVTFNVGGGVDSSGMIDYLHEFRPDVIAFQEWPENLGFPDAIASDWHWKRAGELLVASRFPIGDMKVSDRARGRRLPATMCCDVETPEGTVHLCCLHLYTIRKGLDAVREKKWKGVLELERVSAIRNEDSRIASQLAKGQGGPIIVLGDFNMTSDSGVFHQDWNGWQDAFLTRGFGLGHTFASRHIGLRIDHILADATHWHVRSCRVGPDLRGQHRPLAAELLLLGHE